MIDINNCSDTELVQNIKGIVYELPIFFEFEKVKIVEGLEKSNRERIVLVYKEILLIKDNFEKNKDKILADIAVAAKNLQVSYMEYKNTLAKHNISQKESQEKEDVDLDEMLNFL